MRAAQTWLKTKRFLSKKTQRWSEKSKHANRHVLGWDTIKTPKDTTLGPAQCNAVSLPMVTQQRIATKMKRTCKMETTTTRQVPFWIDHRKHLKSEKSIFVNARPDFNLSEVVQVHPHYLDTSKKHLLKFLLIPLELHGSLQPVTEGNCPGHPT